MISLQFGCALAILATLTTAQSTNYCSLSSCRGAKHIACGNNGKFASSCPKDATIVNLNSHIATILDLHNSRRNQIASGALSGYKPAKQMATMQWDNDLAAMATLNVRQCVMKHDSCRNTAKFKFSGQNLASMYYSGNKNGYSDDWLIKNRISAWWDEYKVCNMNYINKYPSSYSGPAIGHFTVFVADRNIRVGCGAARFTKDKMNNFLIACNYATTNIIGQAIYASGTAGSGCKKGINPKYKSLCSTSEVYTGL